jgi:ribonucleotide reductase alpha subunit
MNGQATGDTALDPALLMHDLMTGPNLKGTKAMLLYEDLARERMREAERVARERRLVRRLSAAKRWERIATWAVRRADRATERL